MAFSPGIGINAIILKTEAALHHDDHVKEMEITA
tara:strand:+ start:4859 stop:4960 length:102 start_codon:yes stop_codon:yes gene_type:complete